LLGTKPALRNRFGEHQHPSTLLYQPVTALANLIDYLIVRISS